MAVRWSRNAVTQQKQDAKHTRRGTFYTRKTVRPVRGGALAGPSLPAGAATAIQVCNLDQDLPTGEQGPATLHESGDLIQVINNTGRTLLQSTRGYAFHVPGFDVPEFFPNTLAECPSIEPVSPTPQ